MDVSTLNSTFAAGGENELSEAIRLYGQPLLRYCHNMLCDYFEAQDAVQITFIKAYNKRKSFTSGTSLSSWLYRIAYVTCIDLLRRKKFMVFAPKANADLGFISDGLKEALLQLSPTDRGLVFSRVIDEKDYAELEQIYHLSASVLRKRYERAKKKLSKILQQPDSYCARLEESK